MIEGNKIYLRAVELTDVDYIYKLENDTELWQFGTSIAPLSKHAIEKFIHDTIKYDIYTLRQLRLMICKNDNNTCIGCVDITDFNPQNKRAIIGIVIEKSERNRGYADEALKLIIKYCFLILSLKSLYCEIADDNFASKKLFLNNGFIINGIKKDWIIINNQWHDVIFLQKFNDFK